MSSRRRSVLAPATALVAALVVGLLGGCASAGVRGSAATADAFDLKSAIAKDYPSDRWPSADGGPAGVIHLLRGFDELPAQVVAPDSPLPGTAPLAAANDRIAVEINTSATAGQTRRANLDAITSASARVPEALGSRLGPIFTSALGQGRLPITAAVIDRVTQGIDGTGDAKQHWAYPRPYVRLGFTDDGGRIARSSNPSYTDLASNGSYPSGHTYRGYLVGTLLATLLPQFAPQLLARASEYGDNRIVLGFHYPLDVMGARMAAQATIAHRWSDPSFVPLLEAARSELTSVLTADCRERDAGPDLARCSGRKYLGRAAAASEYRARLSYGLPEVGAAGAPEIVPVDAPGLLTTAFPKLSSAQRSSVLEQTAAQSGAPLDLTGDGDASWERIDLLSAMTATVTVGADGSVTVAH